MSFQEYRQRNAEFVLVIWGASRAGWLFAPPLEEAHVCISIVYTLYPGW